MAVSRMIFEIFGRDRTASKALRGVGDESERTHKRFGALGGIGKKAGMLIASGAAAAGAAVAAGAVIAVNAASNQQQAFGALDSVYKGHAKSMQTWASRQRDIGLSAAEAGNAAVLLGSQLKGSGASAAEAAKQSQKLVGLGADLAATYGGSTLEAVESVSAAFRGEYDSLEKYGLQIKQSTVNQKALELGLWSGKGALDATAQSVATQALLWEQTKDAQGQAKRESDSYAGAMGRLKATVTNTAAEIGGAFLPAVADAVGWVADKGVPAFKALGEQVMPKLRDMFDAVKKTIDENRPGLEAFGQILANVGGWIVRNVIPAFIAWEKIIVTNVLKAFAALGRVLPPIVSGMLRGIATIVGGFRGLAEAALTTFSGILTVAEKTMGWIPRIGPKIKAARDGFEGFRSSAVEKLKKVEEALVSGANKVDAFAAKSKIRAEIKADIKDLESKLATAKKKVKDPDLTKERKAKLKADIRDLENSLGAAKKRLNDKDLIKERRAHLRATITDLTSKIATAQSRLKDPDLTKTRRAELKAEIGQLRRAVADAKAYLGSVHGKTVVLNVRTVRTRDGRKLTDGQSVALGPTPTVAPGWGGVGGAAAPVNVVVQVQGRSISTSREIAADVRDMLLDLQRVTGRRLLVAS